MTQLHEACEKGDLEEVTSLLSKEECDMNTHNADGESPLHIACKMGHLEVVKVLQTNQKCDLNTQNSCGDTPLHIAVRQSKTVVIAYQQCNVKVQNKVDDTHIGAHRNSIVELVSCNGCDLNIQNKEGDTPLHIAVKGNITPAISQLLTSKQCNPNAQDKDGDAPLHFAVRHNITPVIFQLLSNKQCNLNVQDKEGDTPLHFAAKYGQEKTVAQLLSFKECNPNAQNKEHDTPLHFAVRQSKSAAISQLLAHQQCSINVQNNVGNTPLHIAAKFGQEDAIDQLFSYKECNPNVQNKEGDTPLHIACCQKSLHIIKLLLKKRCSTNIPNKKGETAQDIPLNEDGDCLLHIACQWGDVDIIRYLINDERCNPNVQNADLDTPLHIACYSKSLDIIKPLLEIRCRSNIPNKKGETAQDIPLNEDGDCLLHITCQWGDVDIVRYLITDERCNPHVQSSISENTPLHIAAKYGQNDVIAELLSCMKCNPNAQNKDGDTPLHFAVRESKTAAISKLLAHQQCSINVQNNVGDTPLHIAAKCGHDDTIAQLLSYKECDPNAQNKEGDTPLHFAVRESKKAAISKLLAHQQCSINVQNNIGDTPLHIAAKFGQEDAIDQLFSCKECDPNVQNKDCLTSLLTAIKQNNHTVVTALLQHKDCDPTLCDKHGNTPLHLACIGGETQPEMVKVAKHLLTLTDVDPSCVNSAGQTPIELTTNYQLIQAISHMVKCKTKQSVQTYINMFIVGNPETGKSTLVKAICKEATSILWKIVPKQVRRVKNVPLHTAGIIPTTFRSKTFGNTVLYDLAGQVEYYTSHAAVIQSTVISTPPAFIVVVNLSESEEKISQTLRYWWSFIDNHAARSSAPPQVILIGSHADVVKSSGGSVKEKMTHISDLLKKLPASFHFAGQVALDSRDPASRGLRHLCSLVNQSCSVLREKADVDLRCHVLYAFLLDRFKGKVACTVSDVATSVKENREILPQSPSNLIPLVSTLSDKGLLLLVKGSESYRDWWIILQKQTLLNEINGVIFAPKDFKQHKDLSWSTGVVPFSKLKNEFPDYNPNMVFGFLTHLEFCFKIKDHETLSLVKNEATSVEGVSPNVSEEYYFFPALVSVENPLDVWEKNDSMCCKCGWFYQCIRQDQFLMTQFLHVLILRLAFTFALRLDQGDCREDSLSLCRKCSIWKHGIAWVNRVPIETVVEVGLQYQSVIVLMRCPKGKEAECAQLRSEVIQKVLEAKDEHCKAVKMSESFINPIDVKHPFNDNVADTKFYSLTEIARVTVTREKNFLDQKGKNPIPVQDLLLFDPHSTDTSPELLRELFSGKHSMDETVRSQVLETLDTTLQPVVIQDMESEATTVPKEQAEGRGSVHDLSSQHCTKPTLPELLKFTCTDKRVVNIPVEIAIKYVQFGTFLLDDSNGSRVKIMTHKHSNDAERINIEILQEWLTGRGKQPVTWTTLVEVLRDIELSTLASEIEAVKCPAEPVPKDF